MRGDAERALGLRALRRPLYFGDDLCVHCRSGRCYLPGRAARRVCVEDNTLKVWDVATGECVATLEGHSVPCVAASAVLL